MRKSLVLAGAAAIFASSTPSEGAPGEPEARDGIEIDASERAERPQAIPMAWAEALRPIVVHNVNTGVEGAVRLYRDDGAIDPAALDEFARIAATDGDAHPLSARLVQLVVKAAYHFRARSVLVISAYRPQKKPTGGSRHATGEALDFKLDGVRSPILASELRSYPRAGVGIYTHPRTQYVHLDVRDESYHWIDGSPPGVTWREKGLPDYGRAKRDASYTPDLDRPFITN